MSPVPARSLRLPAATAVLHPDTELRPADEQIGLGVFATRAIPMGTILWALDRLDRVIPSGGLGAVASYRQILDRYAYRDGQGAWVLCWDFARFMNHSCEANSLSTGWDFEIAVRDIAAGEEITADYATLNLDGPFRCLCGAGSCRKWVRPRDFEGLSDRWDASLRMAFADTPKVPQALWRFIPNKREVRRAFARIDRLPSIQRHRFVRPEAPRRQGAERATG